MERDDRAPLRPGASGTATLPRFFVASALTPGLAVTLDQDAAHHIRVRRIEEGDRVGLLDGAGSIGVGRLVRLGRAEALVEVDECRIVRPPAAVHMLVPVADRDRMLWLAEKCAELGAASWRPVLWRRSASVLPRGSGATFQGKVRARFIAALLQSGGAWIPSIEGEASPERAASSAPAGVRILLDPSGGPLLHALDALRPPITIAVGPEGGLEDEERVALADAGFVRAALGDTILRFETAGIAALAAVRVALAAQPRVNVAEATTP